MRPIEIFALSFFGKLSVEQIERIISDSLSIDEILSANFMEGYEKFKAHYDEDFLNDQQRRAQEIGARIIDFWSEEYPELLRQSISPPAVLFCLGNTQLLKKNCVAVVGTRRATNYGKLVTKKIVPDLARSGLVIVSGMAFGIDSIAHQIAIESDGGTIAVLGTGVDVCYPASNRKLYEKIIEDGCIVSEYPLGTKAAKHNFPARNRIIAGLCRATIVTEAPVESGALITARIAAEMGRDVFAVPGDIDRQTSQGCNWLLKMGAIPLTDSSQILEYYGISSSKQEKQDDFLQIFSQGPLLAEQIAEKLDLELSEVLSKLTEYELNGLIMKFPSGHYNKV
ncbi:MAG TPA: DNA-processing protein DprA [Pseudothermotoga sp.]|nr:DNA-processing protein DprA [Pseudothermotoga sp.]HOK83902.1 DNA-processing protein DprA [Pseudothermotoga sp.]HPP70712.1 DNA-processing protein DprA [Pseudothermotoga sp.]